MHPNGLFLFTLKHYRYKQQLSKFSSSSVSPKNLPGTLNPEYLAAQRAYMRYHNMNPIYGTSSKRARAADPDP